MQQGLVGGLTTRQYQWLKVRLGTNSDAEASRLTEVSKDTVRRWRDNKAFTTVLQAIRTDKVQAFRLLSLSLAETALEALEFLLHSPKGSDRKAGLQMWTRIFQLGVPDRDESALLPQQIFNILNVRGDVPDEVLDMVRMEKPRLKAPRVVVLEDEDVAE